MKKTGGMCYRSALVVGVVEACKIVSLGCCCRRARTPQPVVAMASARAYRHSHCIAVVYQA